MNALSYEITNNMKYIGKEGCKKHLKSEVKVLVPNDDENKIEDSKWFSCDRKGRFKSGCYGLVMKNDRGEYVPQYSSYSAAKNALESLKKSLKKKKAERRAKAAEKRKARLNKPSDATMTYADDPNVSEQTNQRRFNEALTLSKVRGRLSLRNKYKPYKPPEKKHGSSIFNF